jgi:hypothetical protein
MFCMAACSVTIHELCSRSCPIETRYVFPHFSKIPPKLNMRELTA